jgi:hypothetical protein
MKFGVEVAKESTGRTVFEIDGDFDISSLPPLEPLGRALNTICFQNSLESIDYTWKNCGVTFAVSITSPGKNEIQCNPWRFFGRGEAIRRMTGFDGSWK